MNASQIQNTADTQAPSTLSFPDGPSPAREGTPTAGPGLSESRMAELWLVQRAQRGEPGAMEQILSEHRGRIERLTQSIVRNPMDAEEVAQDVLMAVSKKIDRFRGDSTLSTWIHRIAVNAALMHKRRDRSSRSMSLDEARPADKSELQSPLAESWTHQPADPTLRREFWEVMWEAVDRLDGKYRSVFVLRDVEGLTTEETANTLGLKIPAVKSRLHRARNALRKRLSGYFNPGSMAEDFALAA